MSDGAGNSPLFEGIGNWILEQGLREATCDEIVQGMGRRLLAGGIPLYRLSVGSMILHPVFGAMSSIWDADNDQIQTNMAPRELLATEEFQTAPFFHLPSQKISSLRQRLDQGPADPEFPIYDQLRAAGVTEYLAFSHSYGRTNEVKWADLPAGMEGIQVAYATRRIGGFAEHEVDYLNALSFPLALALKTRTTHDLSNALLDTYLGRYSGGHVLDGLIERGDGRSIDCVVWFCDLRNSTAMADEMPVDDYLRLLNDYFDCTAGAVMDHGGEVLKFIGDAVMAIFPIVEGSRPPADMCRAAVMAAREALSRMGRGDAGRADMGQPPVRFGISLHLGEVMYGNVGTRRRLDFTVIGPTVNEAARLEGLCKPLNTPVTISKKFKDVFQGDLLSLGAHGIAGKKDDLEVFTLPEFAPAAGSGPAQADAPE
ncbi:MAG: adenylate cyclase [Paracoccaceae bacterium]|jgi:adenylate cyclase